MRWLTVNQEYMGQWVHGIQVVISSSATSLVQHLSIALVKLDKGVLCNIKGALYVFCQLRV